MCGEETHFTVWKFSLIQKLIMILIEPEEGEGYDITKKKESFDRFYH